MNIWTRRQQPHHSELPPSDYSEFLSIEEGIKLGESVSKYCKKIIKKI